MKRKIPLSYKTRALQYFHATAFIYILIDFDWYWLLAGLAIYCVLETVGGNVGLHRYFGHRSFQVNKFVHVFLAIMSTYVGAGSILAWVGSHRYHHDHADKPSDPHSPHAQSLFVIMAGDWDVKISPKYVRDIMRDKVILFLHRNFFAIHVGAILVFLSFGTRELFYLYALPCALCLQAAYLLAIPAHMYGSRRYNTPDYSRNNWWVNIMTLGEGWHNNHHFNPHRVRQGEAWWEWDLPAMVINLLSTSPSVARPQTSLEKSAYRISSKS